MRIEREIALAHEGLFELDNLARLTRTPFPSHEAFKLAAAILFRDSHLEKSNFLRPVVPLTEKYVADRPLSDGDAFETDKRM